MVSAGMVVSMSWPTPTGRLIAFTGGLENPHRAPPPPPRTLGTLPWHALLTTRSSDSDRVF